MLRLLLRQSAMTFQSTPWNRLLPLGRTRRFSRTGILRLAGILGRTRVFRLAGILRCARVLRRTGVRRARIHGRGRAGGGTRRTGIGRQCRSRQGQAQGAGAEHRSQRTAGGGVRFAFQLIRHFTTSSFFIGRAHRPGSTLRYRPSSFAPTTDRSVVWRLPNSDAATAVLLQHWFEPALTHMPSAPWLGYPVAAQPRDATRQSRCNNDKEHASKQYAEAASEHYLQATLGEADG